MRATKYGAELADAGTSVSLLELMCSGVTTIAAGDFGPPNVEWLDGVLQAATQSGARVLQSRMTVDAGGSDGGDWDAPRDLRETPAKAVHELERLRQSWNTGLVEVVPEPLGPLWCTEEMVRTLHDYAVEADTSMFMHMSNSREEERAAHARFGHSTVKEMARRQCLDSRSLYAHAIWLDDDDIALLADHGAAVAHTPVAEAYYGVGIARLPELLAAGVPVGLGVDGPSTNNGQNLWETAKMAILFQKQRLEDATFGSAELGLELLTIDGARALGRQDEIGSLEPGKKADVISIDFRRPSLIPRQSLISNLIYSNDPSAVRSVFVDGVECVSDGRHVHIDEPEVIASAQRLTADMVKSLGIAHLYDKPSRWTSVAR
jgi:5-methylthioadenosine/S-adenosylhomocysteine deaminase